MAWTDKGAFICYSLAALGSIGFGLVYLARSSFMPYHRDAISTPWVSTYTYDGKKVYGPPTASIKTFKVDVKGDRLIVYFGK